jgi:hypothetical protein
MRLILPHALGRLDETQRADVLLHLRRRFKYVVHTAILLFIVTGAFNAIVAWPHYRAGLPLTHALFGVHLLLGLAIFVVSIMLMRGVEPPQNMRALLATNLLLLLLTIAAASSLKYVRDNLPRPDAAPTPGPVETDPAVARAQN